ncbi:MAG TPA: hypothetical protein VFY67_14250 [Pyrinomonadaceae bacterium]|nr:hypothetical protein [Pyrinomonadaceae bacterium]
MKRHLNIPMAMIIVAGVLTISAQAQTSSAQKVIATIPFAFNVGETRLPAGKYTITVANPTSDRKILQIRSANGRSSAMTVTTSVVGNVADKTKLVFQRYGDRYFFAQTQMAGDPTSLAAVKSKAERAEQQTLARTSKKSVVVVIAE